MYKIVVFVPLGAQEALKEAMFAAGAGRQGEYEHCAFETQGTGQFRPRPGANPTLGEVGKLELVAEVRVEMLCEAQVLGQVVKAMRATHPYEEPAYDIIQTLGPSEYV